MGKKIRELRDGLREVLGLSGALVHHSDVQLVEIVRGLDKARLRTIERAEEAEALLFAAHPAVEQDPVAAARAVGAQCIATAQQVAKIFENLPPAGPIKMTPAEPHLEITQRDLCARLGVTLEGLTITEAFEGIGFRVGGEFFEVTMQGDVLEVTRNSQTVWTLTRGAQ